MTQTQALLEALRARAGRGITPIEALDELGCFRLAARVWDLRQQGHDVRKQLIRTWPRNKIVSMYVLHEPIQKQLGL